ncbi:SAF domain-containing protein [Trueperella sp. LYQ141]|uniref:SAF domain-containing protein n=1 Tax=Trueperella sp. LYQ141 TaxID=3391058 RepID=UPI0039830C9B
MAPIFSARNSSANAHSSGSHGSSRTRQSPHAARSARSSPLRAILWRWRWVIASVILAATIYTFIPRSAPEARYPIVVASHEIFGGRKLSTDDLELRMSTEVIPDAVTDIEAATGHYLVAPLSEGAPILTRHLLTAQFFHNAPPGTVIAAVELAAASAVIIETGATIDLYAPPDEFSGAGQATQIATEVFVAGIATDEHTKNFLSETPDTHTYYLAIPRQSIENVIGYATHTPLYAVVNTSAYRGESGDLTAPSSKKDP